MIATLAACGFAATTIYCLGGWCVEAYRNRNLQHQVEAYQAEDWHTSEEMVEFAGRCAWHAENIDARHPPQHLVAPHMVEHYAAGFDLERAAEDRAAMGWNGAMGRAAE